MSTVVLYVEADAGQADAELQLFQHACGEQLTLLRANGIQKALRLLNARKAALLVCSAQLPRASALELLTRVQHEHPDVVRLLVSETEPEPALLRVTQQLLCSPGRAAELALQLREALERHDTSRRVRLLERRLAETERVYALGVMAAGVAQELRNPIAAVATSLSCLRDALSSLHAQRAFGPATIDILQEMALTVADARQGIQGIADISRGIELSQRRRDSEEQADLAEVTRLTLSSLQGELQRRARLHVELALVPKVRASRAKLGQVVLNLVVNAMQALDPRGWDKNAVCAHKNELRVSLRSEGQFVRFDIEDNLPAELDSEQGDACRGLTLNISRQIVEELGGTLRITSGEAGRCFSVLFPEAETPISTSAA